MSSATAVNTLLQSSITLNDIVTMARTVRGSGPERAKVEAAYKDFDAAVEKGEVSKDDAPMRQAIAGWMLNELEDAAEYLAKRKQKPLALYVLGRIAVDSKQPEEAVSFFEQAAKVMKTEPMAHLALAESRVGTGELEAAGKSLDEAMKLASEDDVLPLSEAAYVRGLLLETDHDLESALDAYNQALEMAPDHAMAAFRMGSIFDLRGDDELAISYYERCVQDGLGHSGAMLNLALLYEDRGDHERAIACYRDVIRAEPTTRRFKLFLSGAVESTEEVYDEMGRKEQEKMDQILRTPVADFELSVRSRNVLSRMDINSLGDLVKKTEPEMLAYRNFGETSLREIKQLLSIKNLTLGMRAEEVERRQQRERLALVSSEKDNRVLSTSIGELNLSVRARRCMARLNIVTFGDLVTRSVDELMEMKNFGHTSLTEIRAKLGEKGLTLRGDTAAVVADVDADAAVDAETTAEEAAPTEE